jgi:Domain of Unknown Function (DUF928)
MNYPGCIDKMACTIAQTLTYAVILMLSQHTAIAEDRPPVRVDGGGRTDVGLCSATSESVLALVPLSKAAMGTAATPRLLFYSPYTTQSQINARFVIRDESTKVVMTTSINLPSKPGIIGVTLPKELKLDKTYRWYFSVLCSSKDPSKNPGLEGPIRRVLISPDVESQLKTAKSPETTAEVYAKAGLWIDAINILADKRDSSSSVRQAWSKLLKSEQLENMETKNIFR